MDQRFRRGAAFSILGQVEVWRIEHGRPVRVIVLFLMKCIATHIDLAQLPTESCERVRIDPDVERLSNALDLLLRSSHLRP
jgi:hypothetical protein